MKKDILQDIIANKRIEVARQKQAVSLQTLLALGSDRMERDTRSMRAALESSPSGIIAEFKRKSPSKGWLHPGANIADVVPAYEAERLRLLDPYGRGFLRRFLGRLAKGPQAGGSPVTSQGLHHRYLPTLPSPGDRRRRCLVDRRRPYRRRMPGTRRDRP